jgi:putative transposase
VNKDRPAKYRGGSIRLRGYDYSEPGAYAVTICTWDAAQLFGEVADGEVRLSEYRQVVQDCIEEIPAHSPHATLDTFVIMPNHVHGIIIMEEHDHGEGDHTEEFGRPVSGSLPTIVRSFKSAVTKRINQLRHTPGGRVWQRKYYEHIIRDQRQLDRFRKYILENPLKWHLDRENPDRIRAL